MSSKPGRMGRVSQPMLPLIPTQARSIGPSAGLLEGPGGGVVFIFGLATFSYGPADAVGRRLAAPPVARTTERVAARFGDLVEAPVVITEGAQLPLAGLLLALPALEMTGLLPVAAEVFPPMRKGFYGLRAVLLMGVFLALLREPRAEAATRIRPADLGRLLGLDRAPEVKTLRRKLSELAACGRGALLQ